MSKTIERNKFKDQPIFILGTGPSINDAPLELLKNERVLLLNRASQLWKGYSLPKENSNLKQYEFGDYYFAFSHMPSVNPHKANGLFNNPDNIRRAIIAPDSDREHPELYNRVKFTKQYHHQGQFPIEYSDDIVKDGIFFWGDVCIELALPLCMYWGCNPIYLVGFDASNNAHFDVTNDSVGPNHEDLVIIRQRMVSKIIKAKGFKVYDTALTGNHDAYEKIALESIFKR